ncbi:hypothetical protein ACHAXT_011442 [Thalassiosira profunda]
MAARDCNCKASTAVAEEEAWALPADFDLYATHEIREVRYPPKPQHITCADGGADDGHCTANDGGSDNNTSERAAHSFRIESVEPSSPLDINNAALSSYKYDATGHCVWAGAFLLIQCLHELEKCRMGGERVIELGCGTGIGGLVLLLSDNARIVPSHVCFTDNDPDALKLCERNCKLNNLPEDSCSIQELEWGEEKETDRGVLFDAAYATDVLYDVELIEPLFTTVARCIPPNGIFVLSHIPRACYNEGNPPEAVMDLEGYISDQAKNYGLQLVEIIRSPKEDKVSPEIREWCPASSFIGGGILVFRRL